MQVKSELHYKFIGTEQSFIGSCLFINDSDIVFQVDREIEPGRALEIVLPARQCGRIAAMSAFIEVTEGVSLVDKDCEQCYEITATIKGIRSH